MMNKTVRDYAKTQLNMANPDVEFSTTTAQNEFYIVKAGSTQVAVKTTDTEVVSHVEMDKYDIKDLSSGFKPIESLF